MKRLLIYNYCPIGDNELSFWNAFNDEYGATADILFCSVNDHPDLKCRNKIIFRYDQYLFDPDCDGGEPGPDLARIVDDIAEKDRVWERYDPVVSPQKARSWFAAWLSILKAFRPTAIYVWNGNEVIASALVEAGRALGIETWFLERGPFGQTFVCDRDGINFRSSFLKDYDRIDFEEGKKDAIRLFADNYFTSGVSNWGQPDGSGSREAFLQRYGIPDDRSVLFFPSQIDRDINSKLYSPNFSSVYDAFEHVVRSLKEMGADVFLLGKKHPLQQDDERYDRLFEGVGAWVTEGHIFDFIRYSDGIVSINSSSAVEAALLGKPMLLLGQSILEKNRCVIKLRQKEDLVSALRKLIDAMDAKSDEIDDVYLGKLLFSYLYSVDPFNAGLGMRGVAELPVAARDPSSSLCEYDDLLGGFYTGSFGRLADLQAEVEFLGLEVAAMKQSLSWRWTWPLRYLRGKLGV